MSNRWPVVVTSLLLSVLLVTTSCGTSAPPVPSERSPAALHQLLTGPDGSAFLTSLSTHAWDDGGTEAAELFEWIGRDATSPDSTMATHAGEAAEVLARFLSDERDKLLDIPSGFLDIDHTTVGTLNPALVSAYADALIPFQGRLVCDYRTTVGFDLIADGCDDSIVAARPIFEVLGSNPAAFEHFSDAIHTRIAEYIELFADNDPTSSSNPYPSMLAYSGRLLGLLAVGARQAASAPPDIEDEIVNVNYVLAESILRRTPASQFPARYIQSGQILAPADIRQRLGDDEYSAYVQSLATFLHKAANVDEMVDDALRGQYEFAAGSAAE